jgi:elongation factor P hydroxylase
VNRQLEQLFGDCFFRSHQTLLQGGANEPLYQPGSAQADAHHIHYREDFFASALHEVAHWCVAGEQRRLLADYGYWYAPDGRDESLQKDFERVEVKPQAIEWHFALACQRPFRISNDNLSLQPGSSDGFVEAVCEQARSYATEGLPARARQFRAALALNFGGEVNPDSARFCDREI